MQLQYFFLAVLLRLTSETLNKKLTLFTIQGGANIRVLYLIIDTLTTTLGALFSIYVYIYSRWNGGVEMQSQAFKKSIWVVLAYMGRDQ